MEARQSNTEGLAAVASSDLLDDVGFTSLNMERPKECCEKISGQKQELGPKPASTKPADINGMKNKRKDASPENPKQSAPEKRGERGQVILVE